METLTQVLLAFGISGTTAIAVFTFLGKKLVDTTVQRSFESFKNELTEKTEALKTQLGIFAHEQNLVASRVDTQRTTAISNIYAAICNVSGPLSKLVNGSPINNASAEKHLSFYEEVAEMGHEASNELSNVLIRNAIYVSNDTYCRLYDYYVESSQAIARLLSPIRAGRASGLPPESILADVEQQCAELVELHRAKLLPLAQAVTYEFRTLIGTDT